MRLEYRILGLICRLRAPIRSYCDLILAGEPVEDLPRLTVEGRFRRHFRRANGELWDVVTMCLVLDTQSPGSSYPDAENL